MCYPYIILCEASYLCIWIWFWSLSFWENRSRTNDSKPCSTLGSTIPTQPIPPASFFFLCFSRYSSPCHVLFSFRWARSHHPKLYSSMSPFNFSLFYHFLIDLCLFLCPLKPSKETKFDLALDFCKLMVTALVQLKYVFIFCLV